jgi:hypothetical protein
MHNSLDTFIRRLIHHIRIRDGATDPMWAMLEAVEAAQKDMEEADKEYAAIEKSVQDAYQDRYGSGE